MKGTVSSFWGTERPPVWKYSWQTPIIGVAVGGGGGGGGVGEGGVAPNPHLFYVLKKISM